MIIHNFKNAIVGTFLLLTTQMATAQIEKGVSSIGGNIDFSSITQPTSTSNNFRSQYLNAQPTYGQFLTNRFMIKGKLNTQYNDYHVDQTDFLKSKSADLELEGRYYLNPNANWKYFGGISVGTGLSQVKESLDVGVKYNAKWFTYGAFVGVNKFLNKEVALEGSLGYTKSITHLESLSSSFTNNLRINDIGLDAGLINFINFNKKDPNLTDLIAKGRTVIGLNLSAHLTSNKYETIDRVFKQNYFSFNAEYGRFLTKGLLVGGKINITNVNKSIYIVSHMYPNTPINGTLSAYAQYYYPISKRLMLTSKAGLDYSIAQYAHPDLMINLGIGAAYFVSKNVAIDFNALNFIKTISNNQNYTTQNINSGIGLRYFLK